MSNDVSLSSFIKSNAVQIETQEVVVSKRFQMEDEEGNKVPRPWKFNVISNKEYDKIMDSCKTRAANPMNPKEKIITTNGPMFITKLVLRCVVSPDLNNVELQDSYGVHDSEELLKEMLLPGEFDVLINALQQAHGFEMGVGELITDAKK